jgi:hypothetical protein
MTTEEIKKLAEKQWGGCYGCDENDKLFWINGFITGYLNARIDNLDDKMRDNQSRIANIMEKL